MPILCLCNITDKALINPVMFIWIPVELSTDSSGDSVTVGSGGVGKFPEF